MKDKVIQVISVIVSYLYRYIDTYIHINIHMHSYIDVHTVFRYVYTHMHSCLSDLFVCVLALGMSVTQIFQNVHTVDTQILHVFRCP